MKLWKKLLIVSVTLVLVTFTGYFIYQASRVNKVVTLNEIKRNLYKTSDESVFINFNNLEPIVFMNHENIFYISDYKYDASVLTFVREKTKYVFGVFDEQTIYYKNENLYLFKYVGVQ